MTRERREGAPEETRAEALAAAWADRPLSELVAHLLVSYHGPLEGALRALRGMVEEVALRPPLGDRPRAHEVRRVLGELRQELLDHLLKEERILFPWILRGDGRTAAAPVVLMQKDHRRAEEKLRRLAELTGGLASPPGACTTWCRFVLELQQLRRDLADLITLEDRVLFPRALAGA